MVNNTDSYRHWAVIRRSMIQYKVETFTWRSCIPVNYLFFFLFFFYEHCSIEDFNTGNLWNICLFQVDKNIFTMTKGNSALDSKTSQINSRASINWSDVQWEDLRKPLHSALAVHLYLCILSMRGESGTSIPGIAEIDGQATFWRMHFDTDRADTDPADIETRENFFKTSVAGCDGS